MLKKKLIDIAYKYFPKNICNRVERDKYLSSVEYRNLFNCMNLPENEIIKNNILMECKSNLLLKDIVDKTLFSFDRCFTFEIEIVELNNRLIKICLNISLLEPYYIIYVLENKIKLNPYKWITLPKRNIEKEKTKYKMQIDALSHIMENKFMFNKFPIKFANISIPDLSYQDVRLGEFTIYNAFFHDDNKLN